METDSGTAAGVWTLQAWNRSMDAVIVWVDTAGKEYRRERITDIRTSHDDCLAAGTGTGRQDLCLTLGAILRFFSDLDRLFLITPTPAAWSTAFMEANFPDRASDLRTVSFREVFHDMEGYLPSFSSTSAITLLYRAEFLDSSFTLFTPGCIPLAPFDSSNLMKDGSPLYCCSKARVPSGGRIRKLMIPCPTPMVLTKKLLESYLTEHPGLLAETLRHRFDSMDPHADIRTLLANAPGSGSRYHVHEEKVHGTGILRLSPDIGADLEDTIGTAGRFRFLELAPLASFQDEKQRAIIDFLCHLLQIRFP